MTTSTLSINCPHCRARAAVRTSREISPIYREIYFQCQNVECGHTYKGALSILCTLSPSAMPNPKIVLPMNASKRVAAANDNEDAGQDAPAEPHRTRA